ncbi:MAG TPA: membrane protein insertion efficiency factor YidD [Clostridiales bacterium]|nr:membrane protein insertion efficiency factor YidD [Clostridiales bacterium]
MLLKKLIISLIKFYKKNISPLKRISSCRFTPTCSSYAIEAIEKYGVIKGSYLSIKRILRCHPFNRGGYDPVPKKKKTRHGSKEDK